MLKVWIIAVYKQEAIDKINRVALDYISAVENTGIATAYIIPCNTRNINRYVDDLDIFIIPWGDDIDPSLYKQENKWSHDCIKENDQFLLKFIEEINKTDKLLLWICKGHQLINIFFWWTLQQDIPEKKLHYQYEKQEEAVHDAEIKKKQYSF